MTTPDEQPRDSACEFCDVLNGRASRFSVAAEWGEHAVLVAPHQPTGPGYSLVIPRSHVADLESLGPDAAGPMLAAVQQVSRAVMETFGALGTTIVQNNGEAQSVMHLHFHVVPRRARDGYFNSANLGGDQPAAELARQAVLLRERLVGSTDGAARARTTRDESADLR